MSEAPLKDNLSIEEENCISFEQIKENLSCKCNIKGYVVFKSFIQDFNGGVAGKLFCIVLQDEEGYELKVTFFNESADTYYSIIKETDTIILQNPKIKKMISYSENEKSRFMKEVELLFTPTTNIFKAKDPFYPVIPEVNQLSNIARFANRLDDAYFVCCCWTIGDEEDVSNARGDFKRIGIIAFDHTGFKINFLCWSCRWNDWIKKNVYENSILFIGKCKIGSDKNIGGYCCKIREGSILFTVNSYDDIPLHLHSSYPEEFYRQLIELKKNAAHYNFQELSTDLRNFSFKKQIMTLKEYVDSVSEQNLNEAKVFIVQAKMKDIQIKDCFYLGCRECKLKLNGIGDRCRKCGKVGNGKVLYKTNAIFIEDIGEEQPFSHWGVLFNESAEKLFGITANEMQKLSEEERKQLVEPLKGQEFCLKIRGKMNDLQKYAGQVYTVIEKITPVESE